MVGSVAERTWRDAEPEAIESVLAALWSEVGRQGPIAHALMANLIVVCPATSDEPVELQAPIKDVPIDEVSRRHPSRVVVLRHARGHAHPCGPTAAAVGLLVFGPPSAKYGVEQIAVRSACADESLPSIVRRLALGDVPTTVWWAEDISDVTPVAAIVQMGRQLIYDSRPWRDVKRGVDAVVSLASGPNSLGVADLNWRRLLPMRQALVNAIRAAGSRATIHAVRVRHRPGEVALAWLLAGWLSARGVVADAGDRISIETAEGDDILSLALEGTAITVAMSPSRVLATFKANVAPLVVAVPRETTPDAVAAELRNLRRDVCLYDSLVALSHLTGFGFSR